MQYCLAFYFTPEADISIGKLNFLLKDLGQRTMKVEFDDCWTHKKYKSSIWWEESESKRILFTTVRAGEAVRTCGSLVEWILRNAGDLLDESGGEFEGVSIFK